MSTDSWIMVVGTIAIALVLWVVATWFWRRRIEGWCRAQKFQLVHRRRAWIYGGPRAWWRSAHQNTFFIEVIDTDDLLREGYLVFGSFWGLSRRVEIHWR